MNNAAPSHGVCQSGRMLSGGNTTTLYARTHPPCRNRAMPGSMFCETCRPLALSRMPDRSIGDNRGLRWSFAAPYARGDW